VSAARPAHWGWHQLVEQAARRLVDAAHINRGDLVLDIGAGSGALTAPLVRAGARVIAVELHPGRARQLRHRFADDRVKVVQADATDLRLPRQPFRIVANPPFAITTTLIKRLLAPGSRLVTADLVVPRHVAARWTGERAPGVNRWRSDFVVVVAARLPCSAFRPPPRREPLVLRFEARRARRCT
jgi:23S rRNA (adenine-N6)-dimethyltransferase